MTRDKREAIERHEARTLRRAGNVYPVETPEPEGGIDILGRLHAVTYTGTLQDDGPHLYEHKFDPPAAPILGADGRGQLYVIGGRYTVTERGITDVDPPGLPGGFEGEQVNPRHQNPRHGNPWQLVRRFGRSKTDPLWPHPDWDTVKGEKALSGLHIEDPTGPILTFATKREAERYAGGVGAGRGRPPHHIPYEWWTIRAEEIGPGAPWIDPWGDRIYTSDLIENNPIADTLIRGGRKARELAQRGAAAVGRFSAREMDAACKQLGYRKGNPIEIMYRGRPFKLDNSGAIVLMQRAQDALREGDDLLSRRLVSLAVRVEAGLITSAQGFDAAESAAAAAMDSEAARVASRYGIEENPIPYIPPGHHMHPGGRIMADRHMMNPLTDPQHAEAAHHAAWYQQEAIDRGDMREAARLHGMSQAHAGAYRSEVVPPPPEWARNVTPNPPPWVVPAAIGAAAGYLSRPAPPPRTQSYAACLEMGMIDDDDPAALRAALQAVEAEAKAQDVYTDARARGASISEAQAIADQAAPNPSALPLAPAGRKWSAAAARKRIKKWATQGGRVNWNRYARAFLYRDPKKPDRLSAFKLPIADVIKGELYAVPHGIKAAAAALEGARGGVKISRKAKAAARQWLDAYYRKMNKPPPWPPIGPGTPRR